MKAVMLLIAKQFQLQKDLDFLMNDLKYNPIVSDKIVQEIHALKTKIEILEKIEIPKAEQFYEDMEKYKKDPKSFVKNTHPRWIYVNNHLPIGTYLYADKYTPCENIRAGAECGKINTENTGVVYTENPLTGHLQYICDYCLIDLKNQAKRNEHTEHNHM